MISEKRKAIIAKINRPVMDEVLHRERLFSLLDQGRKRPVVWISGPGGSGKTTLAATYLDAMNLPAVWFKVDPADGDAASFFHYLSQAVEAIAPGSPDSLPQLSPERLTDLASFSRFYFESCFDLLPKPGLLVLDNFQEAEHSPAFIQVIKAAMDAVPPGLNLLVISRGGPPPAMIRFQANGAVSLVGWEDLRFNIDETRAVLQIKGLADRPEEFLMQVADLSRGWAAGLVLMSESRGYPEDVSPGAFPVEPTEIFDYFAVEILGKLEEQVRDFLCRTSLLPHMTAKMAAQLTGCGQSGEILAGLQRNNFFTYRQKNGEALFHYHPLFREFLRNRARHAFSPEIYRDMLTRAAGILTCSGQETEAAALLREAGDWQGLVRLIIAQAPTILEQMRHQTLLEWLNGLPEGIFDGEEGPWLLYWKAMCLLTVNPSESRLLFERAFQGFQRTGEQTGTLLAWVGAVDTFTHEWHDFSVLRQWLNWMQDWMARGNGFPGEEIEGLVAACMSGALLFQQPDDPAFGSWVERALTQAQRSRDAKLRFKAFFYAANFFLWKGNLERFAIIVDELGRAARSSGSGPSDYLIWTGLEALKINICTTDYDKALHAVEEGLEFARSHRLPSWDHMLYAQGAYACLNKGDLPGGADYLEKMSTTLDDSRRFIYIHFHLVGTWLAMLTDDLTKAEAHIETALLHLSSINLPFFLLICRLAAVQVYFETGRRDQAVAALAEIHELNHRFGSGILEFMILLTAADFALRSGRETEGLAALRKALALGRSQNYLNLFWWWRPQVMSRLLQTAIENLIEPEYVETIIRRRRLAPAVPERISVSWPWPIKVFTLGHYRLLVEAEPVIFSRKVQQKPLLLLKGLISLGGREVQYERLTDLLWPEAEGDAAHGAFKTTLVRLRQLLRLNQAVRFQDGLISLNPDICFLDIWAFDKAADRAEEILFPGDHPEKRGTFCPDETEEGLRLGRQALDLYGGVFLPTDTNRPFTISSRLRLKDRFIRLVNSLGDVLLSTGREEEYSALYCRALDTDPLVEDFYLKIMEFYLRLGRRAEAAEVYRRCRDTLTAEFGVTPSNSLNRLHQRIMDAV